MPSQDHTATQSLSTTFADPIELLKLAIDIAIKDTLVSQTILGNLKARDVSECHPADKRVTHGRSVDAACQCLPVRVDAAEFPSQDIQQSSINGTDVSIQCEMSQIELTTNITITLPSKDLKKSVSFLITTPDATGKQKVDMATNCRLPLPKYGDNQSLSSKKLNLERMIDDSIEILTNELKISSMLHPITIAELISYSKTGIMKQFQLCMGTSQGSIEKNKLVNWVAVSGFLKTFESAVSYYLSAALANYKSLLDRSSRKLTKLLIAENTLAESVNLQTVALELGFISVLNVHPVDSLPLLWNSLTRSEQVSSDMSKRRYIGKSYDLSSSEISASFITETETTRDNTQKVLVKVQRDNAANAKWEKLRALATNQKKSSAELLRMRRMAFLDDLMDDLSAEEMSLLQTIFLTINKSASCFISVDELCELLSEAFHKTCYPSMGRKIMVEVDVDQDGSLCLIDLFSIFYLSEIYLQSLGDGFRDEGLRKTASAFTSCHAIVFVAISELCFYYGYRLPMEVNVFITQCEKSNVLRSNGLFESLTMSELDVRVCRMCCFSLLGLDNGVLEAICEGLSDISRLKLSPFWPKPTIEKPNKELIL
ncbi:uncharacterized protein [Watersipora subatra]|uniref:uncharacterized protein n=1 Tax=Watersipora subatra TaxID=2589382 RepID=UPI00355B3A17